MLRKAASIGAVVSLGMSGWLPVSSRPPGCVWTTRRGLCGRRAWRRQDDDVGVARWPLVHLLRRWRRCLGGLGLLGGRRWWRLRCVADATGLVHRRNEPRHCDGPGASGLDVG